MSNINKLLNMFDSATFNALVDKKAEDFNRLKSYRDEMKVGFLVFSLLGIIANMISIASAWQFVTRWAGVLITNTYALYFLTILVLGLIEYATIWLIHKAVKFSLHAQVVGASVFTFFAIVAAVVNFITSTNGLEEKSREMVSKESIITQQYTVDSLFLEARIIPQLDSLSFANSKLGSKTTLQNTTMFAANAKLISDLRQELRAERNALRLRKETELSKDKIQADTKSDVYWKIVVGNQILLFISYIFTAFYYHKTDEQQKDTETRVSEFAGAMRDKTLDAVAEMVNSAVGGFLTTLLHETEREVSINKPQLEVLDTTQTDPIPPQSIPENKPVVLGFSSHNQNLSPDAKNRVHQDVLVDTDKVQANVQDKSDVTAHIKRIQKHANLVRHIIENTKNETEAISNPTVLTIQEDAVAAKYKSRTLIRELFEITKAVGREKVEELICE